MNIKSTNEIHRHNLVPIISLSIKMADIVNKPRAQTILSFSPLPPPQLVSNNLNNFKPICKIPFLLHVLGGSAVAQ